MTTTAGGLTPASAAHQTHWFRSLLVTLVTVRAHALAFSVPYIWMWTEGLDAIVRWSMVVAHGSALLAIGTANTWVDRKQRGVMPRLGLVRGARWCRLDLVTTGAQVLTLFSIAGMAALLATEVGPLVPLSIALLLAGGWLWVRVPLAYKYFGIPEVAGPLFVLLVPAFTLSMATPASPSIWSIVAGASFLVATLLASHLRDRDDDLAADIPTVATRRPSATIGWLWVLAGLGVLTVLTGMYTPISVGEWLGILGAAGFLAATAGRTHRVPAMAAAHAAIGLYWILG